jgi:hypothetical protein
MKFFPPGHFYSPIPSEEDCRLAQAQLGSAFAGIDLRESFQLDLVRHISPFYPRIPDFTYERNDRYRYHYDNDFYSYSDSTIMACLVQYCQPRRFVDIGGGYTTLLMLDLNDTFFTANPTQIAVVEPYPDSLRRSLRINDRVDLRAEKVQNIDISLFEELDRDDVLFLDTTHVCKLGSDVNHIMFEILPRLKSGVRVHVHEVFYPFEYPSSFFSVGKYWNELYLWRAFLMNNSDFEIELFNSFLEQTHRTTMQENFPKYFERGRPEVAVQNQGASLWIRKR